MQGGMHEVSTVEADRVARRARVVVGGDAEESVLSQVAKDGSRKQSFARQAGRRIRECC